ncbi:MAG: carbon-nitrogen hydrolase [Bacteroidota bacterium]
MADRLLKVGLVQQARSSDSQANRARSEEGIRACAKDGADLVVLQELHGGLYFCQTESPENFDQSESIPGPSTSFFGELAKELGIVLVISVFERRAQGLYHNTAVVLEKDGTSAGRYRKMHIPDDPAYYEKYYFAPGDLGFTPINTSVGRLGVLVCWDQWFPEAARLMALAGAEILIYPTAIGYDPDDSPDEQKRQLDAWQTSQRAHAIANGLPVVSVNRVGYESDPSGQTRGIDFWGHSFAAGPQGELLYSASSTDEQTAVVEINLHKSEQVRRIWPYFRDRRIDAYHGLLKRFID